MIDKKKQLGQVFTPTWIVDLILDRLKYNNKNIINEYVFEPGCGDGNFLEEIVKKYIEISKRHKKTSSEIAKGLEKYIYGVEVDESEYKKCIDRLNLVLKENRIPNIKWKIFNQDILDLNLDELPNFDYVIGNPPYVRIHNLNKNRLLEIKERFNFCKNGIIDLFLVFFEIGILSLSKDGQLGFITPNSFIHNSTYGNFRDYLKNNNLIKELIDFKENIVFDNASTYNAITIVDKKHKKPILDYYEYLNGEIIHTNSIDLNYQDSKKWNFTNKDDELFLQSLRNKKEKISDYATIQYGFATLRDKIYIFNELDRQDDLFGQKIEDDILYPVVKGSRYDGNGTKTKILYPYHRENGFWKAIPEEKLAKKYPNAYKYLMDNKSELEKRSMDRGAKWYEFGRSQGVQSIHNEKLVVSPIIKNEIKIYKVDKNTMVYSGIYIFLDKKSEYTLEDIMKKLKSKEFVKYARMLGKDMRGGYKSINTKIIKDFPV